MPEEDGYDVPEEWRQALNKAEQELSDIEGWEEFKKHWKEMLDSMNYKPMSEDEVMVMALASFYEDKIWDTEKIKKNPTEKEKEEDYEKFKQYLRRLVFNAPSLLKDYVNGNGGIVFEIGGHKVSTQSAFSSRKSRKKSNDIEEDSRQGLVVLGYKMPVGKVAKEDSEHAVMGGWMTQDAWDKVKYGRQQELTNEELKTFHEWRDNYQAGEARREKTKADEKKFREWIGKKIGKGKNLVEPSVSNTINTSLDLGIQCFLLSMLTKVSRRPSWMDIKYWVENELGLESIDQLYPALTSEGQIYLLDNLIFKSGYGPNYFDWTQHKPFRLKNTQAKLYLVSIDVGKIAGHTSASVWKVGITKNQIIGKSMKTSRYFGVIGEHTKIIKEKTYRDARDAFMIEQTIINYSKKESFRDRERLGELHTPSDAFEALKSMDSSISRYLGHTEWIFPYRTKEEVIEVWDTMTSYGEFHGEGQVSYSPFKRDFQKQ